MNKARLALKRYIVLFLFNTMNVCEEITTQKLTHWQTIFFKNTIRESSREPRPEPWLVSTTSGGRIINLWLWRSTASITWSWLRDECAVDCLCYKACWRTQPWSHRKQGVGSHLSKPTFDVEVHSMCMWSRTRSPHRPWAWTAATHSGILNYYHSQRLFVNFCTCLMMQRDLEFVWLCGRSEQF